MKYIVFILILCGFLYGSDVEVYDQYWIKSDSLTWTMKLFGQKWNEKRYSAGYDSLESAFMDAAIDSILPDTVTMAPGWLVMQPNKTDTLLNKTRIWGTSNFRMEAPPGYILDYMVTDSSGLYPELGFFISQNDSEIVIDGGHYRGNISAAKMNEYFHGFSFLGSKYIVMKNVRISDWGGDALYINNTKYFKAENCQFEVNNKSLSPLVGRNGVSVVSNSGDSLVSAQFINCTFQGYGSPALVDIEPNTGGIVKNVLFDNCVFQGIGYGIGFEIYLGANVYIENIKLSNSIIDNFNKGVWINCNSKDDSTHTNIVLENVTVSNCVSYGFYILQSEGVQLKNCVAHNCSQGFLINANVVRPILSGCRAFNNNDGFYFAGSTGNEIEDVTVNDCQAYNNARYGLYAALLDKATITNSSFFDNQSTATQVRGLYLYTCDDVYLDGNYERGNTSSNNLYTYNCTDIDKGMNYLYDNHRYFGGLRDSKVLLTTGSAGFEIFADSIASSSGKILTLNNQRQSATSNEIWSNLSEIRLWNYSASGYANLRLNQLISTASPGTAPFSVTSSTLVTNLNADAVDGKHWTDITGAISDSIATVSSSSIWSTSGSDIYYSSGNVGIGGIPSGGEALDVTGNIQASGSIESGAYLKATDGFALADSSGGFGIMFNYTEAAEDYYTIGNSSFDCIIKGGDASNAIYIDEGVTTIRKLAVSASLDLGVGLSSNWDAGAWEIRARTFESDVPTGTPPFQIASTTKVSNLNADDVDGESASDFVAVAGTRTLTGDWDIGNGRMIKADKIRARDGDGLALYEDADIGLFIQNGGKIGHNTTNPYFSFETRMPTSNTYNGISMGVYYDATHYLGFYQGTTGNPSLLMDDAQDLRFGTQSSMGSGYTEIAVLESDGDWKTDGDMISESEIVGSAQQTVTLGAGATTFSVTSNVVRVTGDGGGNTIATITGAAGVGLYTFIFTDMNVTISNNDAHSSNTVDLGAALDFSSTDDATLLLVYDGTSWYKVASSSN